MSLKTRFNIILGVFIVSLLWGIAQYSEKVDYKTHLDNQYQRMFFDLVGHIQNIETDLAKINVSTSPRQNIMLLTSTTSQCYWAQEKMSQLPFDHASITKTEKFLSQVGDYATALAKNALEDKMLSDEERKMLYKLQTHAKELGDELRKLSKNISSGKVQAFDIRKAKKTIKKVNKDMIATTAARIEERMQEYPELIYDGPFSEHIDKIKPKLEGPTVDKDKAKKLALEFLKDKNIKDLVYEGKIKNVSIPGYVFTKGSVSITMSEKAGKPILMVDSRDIGKPKISRQDALKIAREFLDKKGFENMVATYFESVGGEMTVNFAYKQGNVTVYTDLIKVKVALDNGDIIGFESQGYLTSHHKRDIPKPKITPKEGQQSIVEGAEVKKTKLAIIPTEGKSERLCYEYQVSYEGRDFLIYVDALTGKQQKILQLIRNQNGTLTI
ncbi:germination protein YpeB [Alkalithermobacter thermoalcaliphilus JW-YL-7 = DSM 7308]|uniref:Germination protein YpeB n=1 Tax=Alkalithermobacter thermoalcaliphilus JW-YL-7 = DSM 7308 TaxID=1121328 RepID=A0A150FP01_CLOPD|nr:germination protein YpeB [[Clostridium] paradoxum JW-YL-7 = DSM 7308]SHL22041.1 germination protein YpeB [[Clostridium] paradoxum JW-YL-7 = DSM 7308]